MPTPARQTPRPYHAAPQRREQLLAAAGRLVRQGGGTALSKRWVRVARERSAAVAKCVRFVEGTLASFEQRGNSR